MKRNRILRPLISTIIAFAIIVGCISIFKGPSFILVKYYYYKGYSKQKSKDLEGAIDDFTTVLGYDKTNTPSYISRGSAFMDLKKYSEAINDYSEAIKQTPNDARPYAYRGRAYYELADTSKSLNDYNKAISLDSKFDYAYMNRGLLKYALMNDESGGCADLKTALDLGMTEAKGLLEEGHCK